MLTKHFRIGAGACIAMACLLALTVDASAACYQYSARATDGNRGNAYTQAKESLLYRSRNKGTCHPARISCKRASTGWTCTAARDCCSGVVTKRPKRGGRICQTQKSGFSRKASSLTDAKDKARQALWPKLVQFKDQYGRRVCKEIQYKCLRYSYQGEKRHACKASQYCCNK